MLRPGSASAMCVMRERRDRSRSRLSWVLRTGGLRSPGTVRRRPGRPRPSPWRAHVNRSLMESEHDGTRQQSRPEPRSVRNYGPDGADLSRKRSVGGHRNSLNHRSNRERQHDAALREQSRYLEADPLRVVKSPAIGRIRWPVSSEGRSVAGGKYYIQNGYIYGPKMSGQYYILNDYVYGPKSNGKYYIRNGYLYGPKMSGQYYIRNDYIYGPTDDPPWLG